MSTVTLTKPGTTPDAGSPPRPTLHELREIRFRVPVRSLRRWLWDQHIDWSLVATMAVLFLVVIAPSLVILFAEQNFRLAMVWLLVTFVPFAVVIGGDVGRWLDEHLFPRTTVPRWRIKPGAATYERTAHRDEWEGQMLAAADIEQTYGIAVDDAHEIRLWTGEQHAVLLTGRDVSTDAPVQARVFFPAWDAPVMVQVIGPPTGPQWLMGRVKAWLLGS